MTRLKASDFEDSSSSIVVSFHHRWLEPLLNNQVSVIFRKRGPSRLKPDWLYVYIGQPQSSIIGRLPINNYSQLLLDEAFKLARAGRISKQDLEAYATDYKKLAVFKVGKFQIMHPYISRQTLAEKFHFFPPQSFMILSIDGKAALDELAGFRSDQISNAE